MKENAYKDAFFMQIFFCPVDYKPKRIKLTIFTGLTHISKKYVIFMEPPSL